jgi:predicted Fe-S protein YdhL (DUF1289 family)
MPKPPVVDAPILSPCRRQCRLDSTGSYCTGCGRTLDELRQWRGLTNPQRQAIMDLLPQRRDGLAEIQP